MKSRGEGECSLRFFYFQYKFFNKEVKKALHCSALIFIVLFVQAGVLLGATVSG